MNEFNEKCENLLVGEYTMDSNNLSGFKYDSSCSYSKEGDCDCCCEKELVM